MTARDDDSFLRAFEDGSLLPSELPHREHLRMAWLYLRRQGLEAGGSAIVDGLVRFVKHHGLERIYDGPLTERWIARVWRALEDTPGLDAFDAFLAAHPELLRKEAAAA